MNPPPIRYHNIDQLFRQRTYCMKLRAISIDDDPTSILMVKQLADKTENLELVNTYQDAVKGAAGIILDKPDVLFLDIEMPEFNGIEIMRSLMKPPKIIVISGNPNFKDRKLHIQDGLELDIFTKKSGKGTPFLDAYKTLLDKYVSEKSDHDSAEDIINNLLRLGESIGDLMEESRKALDDNKIDESEKEKITKEVIKLEKKISELKLKLNIGEKTDYKSQKKREV